MKRIVAAGSYSDDNSDDWRMVKTKSVLDSDGFQTDYTLYTDDNDQYICMFGDRDLYPPDPVYPDWEGETLARAEEWFDSYNGFDEDEDESDFDIEGATDLDSNMAYADRLGDRIVGILGDEYDMKSQYIVNREALVIEVFAYEDDDFAFYNYVQPLSDIQPAEGDLESDAQDMAVAVMEGLNEQGQSDINSATDPDTHKVTPQEVSDFLISHGEVLNPEMANVEAIAEYINTARANGQLDYDMDQWYKDTQTNYPEYFDATKDLDDASQPDYWEYKGFQIHAEYESGTAGPESDQFYFSIADPDGHGVDLGASGLIDQEGNFAFGIFDHEAIMLQIDQMIQNGYEIEDEPDIGEDFYGYNE